MTKTTLKEYTFNSIVEHLSEMNQHVASKTKGDLIIISIVVDNKNNDSGMKQIGLLGSGSNRSVFNYLLKAAESVKEMMEKSEKSEKSEGNDGSELDPKLKQIIDKIFEEYTKT